jgi:hypothetical protein
MDAQDFIKKYGHWTLLAILSVTFFILAVISPLSYGGADDIVHYRFARYSFQHPELLLDHWAKPFFTLLASPFAQLGYWGVKLFNILIGAFTAYILYRMAGLLSIHRNIWVILMLFFTPVYTTMVMSGMTEVLFAAVLTFAAFLFLQKNFIYAAIVISFLPIVRTEGVIIWTVYLVGFLLHRQWKAIPFILTASLLYSVVGGIYFRDFFWLVTHIPYTGTYDIYGHGDILHFVRSTKLIFGIPLTLLFFAGITLRLVQFFKPAGAVKNYRPTLLTDEFIVLLVPLADYYLAHTYVWWKGINSLGLIRVMAGVAPLFVIYSMWGMHVILDRISIRLFKQVTLVILLLFIAVTPFKVYEIPLQLSPKDQLVGKAAEWFITSPYKNRKYYIWDCYFYFVLDTNPYDPSKMADGIPDRKNPENLVKPGEIVIWDAHFSAVDGRFPLSAIIDNPYYKLIKVFRPAKPFPAGGGTYQVCFFERQNSATAFNNKQILDSLTAIKPNFSEIALLDHDYTDSGNNDGYKIKPQQEYLLLKELEVGNDDWASDDELNIKIVSSGKPVILAVSVGDNRKPYFYESFQLNNEEGTTVRNFNVSLPKLRKKNQKLKVYLWNNDNSEATIKHAEIKLMKLCGS